jgi:hypothetical protein
VMHLLYSDMTNLFKYNIQLIKFGFATLAVRGRQIGSLPI